MVHPLLRRKYPEGRREIFMHRRDIFTVIKLYVVETAATVVFVAVVAYVVGYELSHLFNAAGLLGLVQ
jgi:hypothetical protein